MVQFFQTIMGRQFFEGTMPNIMRSLNRIADALDEQNKRARQGDVAAMTLPVKVQLEVMIDTLHWAHSKSDLEIAERIDQLNDKATSLPA